MAFSINEFYSALEFGGSRSNLFDVIITWPGGELPEINFMARATQIPGATLNTVTQPYFGRELKFAGNRTFEDWTVTIINDEDYLIRDGLERWSEALNGFESNVRDPARLQTSQYKGTGTVNHYGKTGNILRTYEIRGILPTAIAPIQLDWGNDEIVNFDTTFSMDYWVATRTNRANITARSAFATAVDLATS